MSADSPTNPSPSTETSLAADEPVEPTAPSEHRAEIMAGATPEALREEVRRLRDEAGEQRVKGKRADTLTARLVEQYAAATGLLADVSDLRADPATLLDDDGLPDPVKVREAVEALITSKPHLASRTPRGDIEQGARDDAADVSLTGLLRPGT